MLAEYKDVVNYNTGGAASGGGNPVGMILMFMGKTTPSGYLACDGAEYNIASYSELADFFEAQFGTKNYFGGDGETTFAVPDLRGEFLRGTGKNSHSLGGTGAAVGVHQAATKFSIAGGDGSNEYESNINIGNSTMDRDAVTGTTAAARGSGVPKQLGSNTYNWYMSRPVNTSVLYCIKY